MLINVIEALMHYTLRVHKCGGKKKGFLNSIAMQMGQFAGAIASKQTIYKSLNARKMEKVSDWPGIQGERKRQYTINAVT